MKQKLHKICKTEVIFTACLALLLTATGLPAATTDTDSYLQGQEFYQSGNYENAIRAFEKAVEIAPNNSVYHHWLGKSYGQLARQSGLIKAYDLSRKTKTELETAVELDNHNVEALADLMKYYEQAPAFLGGSKDKAEKIRLQLEELDFQEFDQPEV